MNYDPLVPCAYDPAHLILRSRLIHHYGRCSKNFPNSKKQKCPFDATHVIDELEFQHHIDNCPGREAIIHFERKETDDNLNLVKLEPHVMDEEGSWDKDTVTSSYNPYANSEKKPVLRNLMVASKSKKKDFQFSERQRFQKLENENYQMNNSDRNGAKPMVNNNFKNFESNDDDAADCTKPLRPPIRFLSNKSFINQSSSEEEVSKSAEQTAKTHEQILKVVKQSNGNLNIEQSSQENQSEIPTTSKPFSYASMLNKNKEKIVCDKNNTNHTNNVMTPKVENNPNTKITVDYDKISDLTKTVEKIAIDDDELRKKSEPLIQTINMLKLGLKDSKMKPEIDNKNNNVWSARCAAKFLYYK